ncbi:MAG: hypothetical protein ACI9CV_000926 [Ilumatobacter sp.]|jgi:hypothetical protein
MVLGEACDRSGDLQGAHMERRAASAAFDFVGVVLKSNRVQRWVAWPNSAQKLAAHLEPNVHTVKYCSQDPDPIALLM